MPKEFTYVHVRYNSGVKGLRIHLIKNGDRTDLITQSGGPIPLQGRKNPIDLEEGQSVVQLVHRVWGEIPVRFEFACIVCGSMTADAYMVRNNIWHEAGFADGHCHVTCLEEHLGRKLTLNDFTDAPINDIIRFAFQRGAL